jgi:branched-chain amino acid transport system ATP-binding protein
VLNVVDMADSGLVVSQLNSGYGGIAVLHDVDLHVRPGELVALVGPNGAGKSTLLLTCSGLVRATSGVVSLDGRDLARLPAHKVVRAGVVQVAEDRSLFYGLTVEENLRVAANSPGLDAFELFPDLRPLRRRRAGLLSGGEQQMLCLARALYCKPRILLVDEMSLGLAPIIVDRLFSALARLAVELNLGVLIVEQHVHLALRNVQRGYVLSGGRVTAEGSAEDLERRWPEIEASYLGVAALG